MTVKRVFYENNFQSFPLPRRTNEFMPIPQTRVAQNDITITALHTHPSMDKTIEWLHTKPSLEAVADLLERVQHCRGQMEFRLTDAYHLVRHEEADESLVLRQAAKASAIAARGDEAIATVLAGYINNFAFKRFGFTTSDSA